MPRRGRQAQSEENDQASSWGRRAHGEPHDKRRSDALARRTAIRCRPGPVRLEGLRTDRLDVLHIHSLESFDDLAAIEAKDGVLKVVRQAREEKRARFIGITGHASPAAMQTALERHKGPHPVPMYYALSLPVSLASVGMPRPELLDRNVALARSFAPLGDIEMQSLRAAVGDSKRQQLAQFFAHHRDA